MPPVELLEEGKRLRLGWVEDPQVIQRHADIPSEQFVVVRREKGPE